MDPAPLVLPLFFRAKASCPWEFRGTTFQVAPHYFLTARHCVDWGKWEGSKFRPGHPEGAPVFTGVEDQGEFALAAPGDDGGVVQVPVTRILRRISDPRLDAAVLVAEEFKTPEPISSVTWLEGLDEEQAARTGLTEVGLEARGYSKISRPAGGPARWIDPSTIPWSQMAAPSWHRDTGLQHFRLPEGGLPEGLSGSPVFVKSAYGAYCVGLGWMGGLAKGPALVLGSGPILAWLAEDHPGLRSQLGRMDVRDLPPEAAAPYLAQVREQVRSLLVPLLRCRAQAGDGSRRYEVELKGEADFIRLFVCLHARREGAHPDAGREQQEKLQAQAERDVYGRIEAERQSFDPLPPYEEAVAGEGASFWIRGIRAALRHCTQAGRHNPLPADLLTREEQMFAMSVAAHLNRQLDAGWMRLEWRPPVWEALQSAPGVVLVGAAGRGKSTVAQFFALAMAMPKHRSREPKLRDLFGQIPDLRGRVPVFLRFRDLGERLKVLAKPSRASAAAAIQACLVEAWGSPWTGRSQPALPPPGDLAVIWDGFDELDPGLRKGFAMGLTAWVQGKGRGAFNLVTTRPTAYPAAGADGRLEGFPVWHLDPLDPMQQRELLEGFLRVFGEDEVTARASEILALIRQGQSADLAEDPLMLAGLVRLAHERRKDGRQTPLPERRMEILSEIVDLMLYRWEEARADGAPGQLAQALEAGGKDPAWLRGLLSRLAWESLVPVSGGAFARDRLATELKREVPKGHQRILEALDDHAGLIRPIEDPLSGIRAFEFPLWSCRNFLAASVLATMAKDPYGDLPAGAHPDLKAALQAGAELFLAGVLSHGLPALLGKGAATVPEEHAQQVLKFASALAVGNQAVGPYLDAWMGVAEERLAGGRPAMPILRSAVELAEDVGQWKYPAGQVPATWTRDQRSYNVQRMLDVARAVRDSAAEQLPDRAAAASLVGILAAPADHGAAATGAAGEKKETWCRVGEKGRLRFRMGDALPWGGGGSWSCDLVRAPFFMRRWPVSVALFHRVGGPAGLTADSYGALHPTWRLPVFQMPTHPVVGVDWQTATRWCEEATRRMREGEWEDPWEGELPPEVRSDPRKWEVRLPEEWEWEFAARGPEAEEPGPGGPGRMRVPWGWASEEEVAARVNCLRKYCDGTRGGTTPVDWGHPDNVSWCGVEQMAGLVWEWCRTASERIGDPYNPERYEEEAARAAQDPGVPRVLRGGSWSNLPGSAAARTATRARRATATSSSASGRCSPQFQRQSGKGSGAPGPPRPSARDEPEARWTGCGAAARPRGCDPASHPVAGSWREPCAADT